MVYLLVGFLLIWLLLGGLRAFAQASPAALARLIKRERRRGGSGDRRRFFCCAAGSRWRIGFAGLGFWLLNIGNGGIWRMFASPAKGSAQRGPGRRRGPRVLRPVGHDRNGARSRDGQDARQHSRRAGRRQGARFADAASVRSPLRPLPSRRSGGRPSFAGLSRSPVFRLASGRRGARRLSERQRRAAAPARCPRMKRMRSWGLKRARRAKKSFARTGP